MTVSKDYSEIQEAAALLLTLLAPEQKTSTLSFPGDDTRQERRETLLSTGVSLQPSLEENGVSSRGERLDNALEALCRRGGFSGAVIADTLGLPVGVFNSPVSQDAIAAFTSVLGNAIDKAGHILNLHNADNISMDVNYTDKMVLRRFNVGDRLYFMMVICAQSIDERSEVELSLDQIIMMLN